MKKILVLFVLITSSFLVGGSYVYIHQRVQNREMKTIYIPKGVSLSSVADLLARENIINKPQVFTQIIKLYPYAQDIKYGEFLIEPTDSFWSVYKKMTSGQTLKHPVTLTEGTHIYEYGEILSKKGLVDKNSFFKKVKDPVFIQKLLGENQKNLEGYLFPDTYYFSKNDGEERILKTMVDRFKEKTQGLNFNQKGLNRHKAITLASLIEKETGAKKERRKISSVFHNRMKKKMKLQTDPTIIYGIMVQSGVEIKNIRKKDILAPTDYNTYVIRGLPPGPIANPGVESIRAALNPEETSYLYFVSRNNGTHVFSQNYKDHLKAVAQFQLKKKAQRGRSWRDLKRGAQ